MVKIATAPVSIPFALDSQAETPLHRQLYEKLRHAILTRQLVAGTRLPATRLFARELGVSRNTIITAFDQLSAEGYLTSTVGDGTYVAREIPDLVLQVRTNTLPAHRSDTEPPSLSRRGMLLAAAALAPAPSSDPRAFRPGVPALDSFLFTTWSRLVARRWRNPPHTLFTYGDAAGYLPLREAIATYVRTARGVRCEPSQIIIVSGSQHALDLSARILLDPGDAVWIEDPGYLGAREALRGADVRLIPIPVDHDGLNVRAGLHHQPRARMVYVSPSHQYPLGVTMSLTRRLELLDWAKRTRAWILEDDYDSEYRYVGRPLAALQGLDSHNRVIYIGTFSKVLFPALRLGYMIVPPDLVNAFVAARAVGDRHSPSLDQAVLADFIEEGHFIRHIRRMRALYAERQAVLVAAIQAKLSGFLTVKAAQAGMHLVGMLPAGVDDRLAAEYAQNNGVETIPLSHYSIEQRPDMGLILGYAGYTPDDIRAGVRQLATALATLQKNHR